MKKVMIILLVTGFVSCQHKNENAEKKSVVEPTEVQMDKFMHDFGNIHSGEIVVYNFLFKNNGSNDLIIKSAEADCGCVTVNLSENVIKPGKQGKIEVQFDSSGLFGKELKTIDLDWNCKEPKQLVIFATVENEDIEIIY